MNLLGVFSTLILFSVCTREISGQNPGLQIRITERGVHKAIQVAIDLVSSRIQNAGLQDFSDTSGDLNSWFTGLRITRFQKPSTDVDVSPNVGITWNGRNAVLGVNGNWRFKYRKGIFRFSDSGRISVSASGVSFSVSFTLGMSASGQPTVRTTRCAIHIGDLDVDVSGSLLSFIYNVFIRLGRSKIKDEAEEMLCKLTRDVIDQDLNKDLSEVEVMETLADDFLLDYRLISVPRFANGHFDSYHKGEFRSRVNPTPFPSSPVPFPLQTVTTRMINVWGSDYVCNSFAYAAFKRGLLHHQISNREISGGVLQTTCDGNALCLGKLFPELNDKYPNGEGELEIKATQPPTVHISPGGIGLTLDGEVGLQFRTQDDRVHSILTLSLTLNMSVSVYLDGNVMRGSVTSFCPVVKVKETTINNVPTNTFQALFDVFVKKSIVENLDEIGLKGIDIPHLKNTRFSNIMLVKNEGNLMLAADVIWAPDSPNTPVKPSPPQPDATRQPLAACYDPALLTVPRQTTTSPPNSRNSTGLQSSAPQCMTTWVVLSFCAVILKVVCN